MENPIKKLAIMMFEVGFGIWLGVQLAGWYPTWPRYSYWTTEALGIRVSVRIVNPDGCYLIDGSSEKEVEVRR